MLRAVLVMIHAAAGVGGLATGLFALIPPYAGDGRRWLRQAYLLCVALLLGSMVALVALDWSGLNGSSRLAFSALTGLGAVMAYRLVRAGQEARERRTGWPERYIHHVYFTYIALWIGFLVLPALNLPFPALSVPLAGLAVLLVGNALLSRFKPRIVDAGAARTDPQPDPVPASSTSRRRSERLW